MTELNEPAEDPGHLLPIDDWLNVVGDADFTILDFSDLRMAVDSPLVTYSFLASSYGGTHTPNIGVIHDVESPLQAGFARSLIGPNWFGGPAKTSTHYIVDPVDICQGVPENRIAWHVGGGNARTIAVEQAGYARFSRAEWTTPEGMAQHRKVAQLMADINKRRPLIKLRWLSDNELRYAWNTPGSPGGWATHNQMRRVIGGTTHYDPFNSPNTDQAYPSEIVMGFAVDYRNDTPKDWFDMATADELRAIVREEVARLVTPKIINDVVANVLRADEFKLDADRRGQDMFRAITDVLHSPEFAGWQEVTRKAAGIIIEGNAPKD